MSMSHMTLQEFDKQLQQHEVYVHDVANGIRDKRGKLISLVEFGLYNVNLNTRNLSGATFVRCHIKHCRFTNCDLSSAVLIGSIFENCEFVECDLYAADFRSSICVGNNFNGSNLSAAQLNEALFVLTNLRNCNLNESFLVDTDLRFSNLENANLSKSIITGTKLYGANISSISSIEDSIIENVFIDFEGKHQALTSAEALKYLGGIDN